MTETAVTAQGVGNTLWELLGGTADQVFTTGDVNLFRGRVDAPPANDDGTVENYAVLYESPGLRAGSRMGSASNRWSGTFQVTCAGRDPEACLWTVGKVTGLLTGARVVLPGRSVARRIVEDPSNQSRTVVLDEDVSPPRYYAPLLFRIAS